MLWLWLDLQHSRRSHSRSDAHGHDSKALLRAVQLVEERRDLSGPGAPQRMPEGNRSPVRIDPGGIDVEDVDAPAGLRRKGLVDLPDVNVANGQAALFQHGGNGHGGSDPHDAGGNPLDGVSPPDSQNGQSSFLGLGPGRDQHGGRPVGGLGRIAGGRLAVLGKDGLELGQDRKSGPGPNAVVLSNVTHRNNLVAKPAGSPGGRRLLVGLCRKLVQVFALQSVLRHDVVARHAHGNEAVHDARCGMGPLHGIPVHVGSLDGRHGRRRHGLDAPANAHGNLARGNIVRHTGHRLESRAALPIDPGQRRGLGVDARHHLGHAHGRVPRRGQQAVAEDQILDVLAPHAGPLQGGF
mmetsp:Transcript_21361/g.50575  ORF Transcript_21361/g.50575 Transcript_21361/m.50575 type:complete len:352 (+) Transcript_21361:125-1180(+)